MGFTITFQGAKDFTPYEGGGDLYPFEGFTFGKIEKIETGKSSTGNETFIFTLGCEEPEAKGLKAKKWVPVSGSRKDGKPNVLGLYEAITAVYSMSMKPEEALAKLHALEGRGIDSDVLINELTGKAVAYEVGMRAYDKDDGTVGYGTEVKNFVLRHRYDEAKAINAHHRPLPERAVQAPRAPSAAGVMGGGLGTPNGAGTPVAQPAAAKGSALGIL